MSLGPHAGILTAESITKGCPVQFSCNLQEKLCLPIYTVVQAILNLANPAGSTEFEILSQAPVVCTSYSVGPAQVQQALQDGLRRRVLCVNEDLYNCFKPQLFCASGQCTPCPCPCRGPTC